MTGTSRAGGVTVTVTGGAGRVTVATGLGPCANGTPCALPGRATSNAITAAAPHRIEPQIT